MIIPWLKEQSEGTKIHDSLKRIDQVMKALLSPVLIDFGRKTR